jgi:hypothetical protein
MPERRLTHSSLGVRPVAAGSTVRNAIDGHHAGLGTEIEAAGERPDVPVRPAAGGEEEDRQAGEREQRPPFRSALRAIRQWRSPRSVAAGQ